MVGRRTLLPADPAGAVTRWRDGIAAAKPGGPQMRAAWDALRALATLATKAGERGIAVDLEHAAARALTDVFELFAPRLTACDTSPPPGEGHLTSSTQGA